LLSKCLGMQWGWNHNPVVGKWSLTENPGHLRLYSASVTENFRMARNTLTQRLFAYYSDSTLTVGTVKMDISEMKDGDVAGLGLLQNPFAYIAAKKHGAQTFLVMVNDGEPVDSLEIDASTIYLQTDPKFGTGAAVYYNGYVAPGTRKAHFYYSFDNENYYRLGNELRMEFDLSVFTGNKISLFNYSTKQTGGYVDIDWFQMKPSFHNN
jgi:hypothetical protein